MNFERYVDLYAISETENSAVRMKSWIKKARMFRACAKEVVQQDMRKFGKIT